MRISDWSSDVCSSDLHGPDGQPYDDLAEMSRRAIAAAEVTGIGITQLPVLYGYGGFGAQKAGEGQRRFLNDPSRLLRIVETLKAAYEGDAQVRVGIAPQSLRARSEEHTSELQSLMRISYAVFCLKKKTYYPHIPRQDPEPQ